MPSRKIIITTKVPPKKSLYRRRSGGKGLYTDRETKTLIDGIILEMIAQWRLKPVKHPEITFSFRFNNMRRDRDGAEVTLLDCMTQAGILVDDSVEYCNGKIITLPATVNPNEQDMTIIDLNWWTEDETD